MRIEHKKMFYVFEVGAHESAMAGALIPVQYHKWASIKHRMKGLSQTTAGGRYVYSVSVMSNWIDGYAGE